MALYITGGGSQAALATVHTLSALSHRQCLHACSMHVNCTVSFVHRSSQCPECIIPRMGMQTDNILRDSFCSCRNHQCFFALFVVSLP